MSPSIVHDIRMQDQKLNASIQIIKQKDIYLCLLLDKLTGGIS